MTISELRDTLNTIMQDNPGISQSEIVMQQDSYTWGKVTEVTTASRYLDADDSPETQVQLSSKVRW